MFLLNHINGQIIIFIPSFFLKIIVFFIIALQLSYIGSHITIFFPSLKKKLFFLLVHSYCYTSSNLSLPPYLPITLHVTVTILLSLFLIFRLFFSLSYFELIQRHFSYFIHIFPHRMLVLSLSLFGF